MKKYKIEFTQTERFVVDVFAETQEQAEEIATEEWNKGNYHETGDINTSVSCICDVTDTDDFFDSVN